MGRWAVALTVLIATVLVTPGQNVLTVTFHGPSSRDIERVSRPFATDSTGKPNDRNFSNSIASCFDPTSRALRCRFGAGFD